MQSASDSEPPAAPRQRLRYFLKGVSACLSLPGLILASAFVGFGGLAKESGLSLAEAAFMIAVIWALPGKVVLIGSILSGSSLAAAFMAVSLSSVRLMPMVVALVPELRTARTPAWVLYAESHFVAVTSWVLAMQNLPSVPRPMRTTYYAGMGLFFLIANIGVVAIVYLVAERLPPVVNAALLLLTPMYFLTSLWGSAREKAGRVAMVFGLVLGPLFHVLMPGFDLVAGGVIGGLGAFAVHRVEQGRRRP